MGKAKGQGLFTQGIRSVGGVRLVGWVLYSHPGEAVGSIGRSQNCIWLQRFKANYGGSDNWIVVSSDAASITFSWAQVVAKIRFHDWQIKFQFILREPMGATMDDHTLHIFHYRFIKFHFDHRILKN